MIYNIFNGMTLKNKVVAFFVIFLTTILIFCLFFFYSAVKDEMTK